MNDWRSIKFVLTLNFLLTSITFGFVNPPDEDNPVDFFYDNYDDEMEDLPEEDKKQTVFYKEKQMGNESLAIIQSISKSKKTIVLRKGRRDLVSPGMEALISTDKVSILAKARQVSRFFSLWEVVDSDAIFPFAPRDYVVFNSSTISLFDQIPSLKKRLQAEIKRREFIPPIKWIMRASGSVGVYETVSDTGSSLVEDRIGGQFSISRYKQIATRLEWGLGARVDIERAILKSSPRLEIPTYRYYLSTDLLYHFPYLKTRSTHFYGGLGLGIGYSETSISESVSSGLAVAIPVMRVGLETKISTEKSFLIEGVAEGVSMQESFQDGTKQNTNIANLKLTIGLKF